MCPADPALWRLEARALAIPPLNTTLARLTMTRTKIYEALKGVRGRPPVDLALLNKFFVRFSDQTFIAQSVGSIGSLNVTFISPFAAFTASGICAGCVPRRMRWNPPGEVAFPAQANIPQV